MYFDGYVEKRLHKNLDQALVALERAITLDPNLAVAQNHIGQIKLFLGRADEAAAHTLKALRLSPRDPRLAEWYYQMALNSIHQQRYDEHQGGHPHHFRRGFASLAKCNDRRRCDGEHPHAHHDARE